VYAPETVQASLRERLRKSRALATDAWLERNQPKTANQFVQIQPLEAVHS
jgi:hypothetical protein